jgi:hypothetical protein
MFFLEYCESGGHSLGFIIFPASWEYLRLVMNRFFVPVGHPLFPHVICTRCVTRIGHLSISKGHVWCLSGWGHVLLVVCAGRSRFFVGDVLYGGGDMHGCRDGCPSLIGGFHGSGGL